MQQGKEEKAFDTIENCHPCNISSVWLIHHHFKTKDIEGSRPYCRCFDLCHKRESKIACKTFFPRTPSRGVACPHNEKNQAMKVEDGMMDTSSDASDVPERCQPKYIHIYTHICMYPNTYLYIHTKNKKNVMEMRRCAYI